MTEKLLIVDDQPGIRLLLTDILTNEGYTVVTADNGKDAIDMLATKSYELIMLDYKLPIINGGEIVRRVQELKLSTPIIVMSGLIESIEAELKAIPNVKRVLAKPFNVQEIPHIVKQTIDAS